MNINGDRLMWLHVYGTLAEIRRRGDRSSSKLLMTVYAVIHTGMLNFAKCWPILIILSLPYFQINCRDSWNKICHLTSNVLQHYLAKIEYSTVQVLQHVIQCKCDAESFIYGICLPEMLITISYVYTDSFTILQHGGCSVGSGGCQVDAPGGGCLHPSRGMKGPADRHIEISCELHRYYTRQATRNEIFYLMKCNNAQTCEKRNWT